MDIFDYIRSAANTARKEREMDIKTMDNEKLFWICRIFTLLKEIPEEKRDEAIEEVTQFLISRKKEKENV